MGERVGLERRRIDLDGAPAGGFAAAAARAVGADGLLVFEPADDGGLAVRLAEPGSLEGLRLPEAGLPAPGAGRAVALADPSSVPGADRFPRARWAVAGQDLAGRFTAVWFGRGRSPRRLVADPTLSRFLLSQVAGRLDIAPAAEASGALSRLSHEFKTPLVGIKGYAELILDRADPLDPRAREWARRIAAGANRLASVLRRVTAEARTGAPWAYDPRPAPPDRWLPWCVDQAESLAAGRSLAWSWAVAPDTPAALVDREAVRDAVLELLQNAARATPDGGGVRAEARPEARGGRPGVRVTVTDSGRGVPAGDPDRLFGRFVTGTPVLAHHSGEFAYGAAGLGLGLPLVRGIARAHGGEAWIEARSRGAAVHLWLPAAGPGEGAGGEAPVAGGAVLLVEPDPESRGILAEALSPACEVVVVDTADRARARWAERADWLGAVVEPRFDGGGVDLVRDLVRSAGPDGPPVLVYTTTGPGEAGAYRAVGAAACLAKPARSRAVLQRLHALTRRRGLR